jgi:hypothetical protein
MAPSMSIAFRSGIFCSAMARTWSLVTLARLLARRQRDEPFSDPGGLPEQERGRRRLGDERERPVL